VLPSDERVYYRMSCSVDVRLGCFCHRRLVVRPYSVRRKALNDSPEDS